MAMTFSSQGCRAAATDLNTSARALDGILNVDLTNVIGKVKGVYDSETATQLYDAFEKVKAKFPDFIQSITDCSTYLSETVAPAYEKVESTAAGKIN